MDDKQGDIILTYGNGIGGKDQHLTKHRHVFGGPKIKDMGRSFARESMHRIGGRQRHRRRGR